MVKVLAPAKVNLTLAVLDRLPSGYHNLASLVAFADFADSLDIAFGEPNQLEVVGAFAFLAPKENNSIFAALDFLGTTARVKLEKNIPVGAGLGGGSADCAAVLRAFSQAKGARVPAGLFDLGADVPACFLSQALWLSGAGEQVESVAFTRVPCVLASALTPVATKDIFAAWEKLDKQENRPAPEMPSSLGLATCADFCRRHGNDLTPLVPEAEEALAAFAALTPAPMASGMSGSGGACFALYENFADALEVVEKLKTERELWAQACWLS